MMAGEAASLVCDLLDIIDELVKRREGVPTLSSALRYSDDEAWMVTRHQDAQRYCAAHGFPPRHAGLKEDE
jgi:hypothetical protein